MAKELAEVKAKLLHVEVSTDEVPVPPDGVSEEQRQAKADLDAANDRQDAAWKLLHSTLRCPHAMAALSAAKDAKDACLAKWRSFQEPSKRLQGCTDKLAKFKSKLLNAQSELDEVATLWQEKHEAVELATSALASVQAEYDALLVPCYARAAASTCAQVSTYS